MQSIGGKLGGLSDQQLLQSLQAVIRRGTQALAELLAHLAEVEERRLHLRAASPSLFSYCVSRLGFSEDEACRRIEVARLARRYPALLALVASGELSLSVAALLKPHLSEANCQELLAAVAGKTVLQAREALAAHFPQPDVPSRLRKLPERRPSTAAHSSETSSASREPALPALEHATAPAAAETSTPGDPAHTTEASFPAEPSHTTEASTSAEPSRTADTSTSAQPSATLALLVPAPPTPLPHRPPRPSLRVAPLAPARYKVEFTADAELKAKLELARDLMRHANPGGDFAPILSRALELLIDELRKRRFGARAKSAASEASMAVAAPSEPHTPAAPAPAQAPSSSISRSTRRRVAERDGLRCCWQDESGRRCNSQAWLEHDHRWPSGKGGSSDAGNVRLLCRAHNRLEAERHFGRQSVERAIARFRHRQRRGREDPATRREPLDST